MEPWQKVVNKNRRQTNYSHIKRLPIITKEGAVFCKDRKRNKISNLLGHIRLYAFMLDTQEFN